MKNKLIATLVVLALMASSLMVTTVVAETKVDEVGSGANWILSNDGFGNRSMNLTCGEVITLQITNNSLNPDTRYKVGVWNGSDWVELTTVGGSSGRRSDDYGDLSVDFHVPGWDELDGDPVNTNATFHDGDSYTGHEDADTYDNGTWNISLFNDDFDAQIFDINITIKIGNHHYLEFFDGDEEIDHMIFNKVHNVQVKIYNWTDGDNELADDLIFDVRFLNFSDGPTSYTDGNIQNHGTSVESGISSEKPIRITEDLVANEDLKELTFWFGVQSTDGTESIIPLPVLLNVTLPSPPEDVKWGDSFTLSGNVLDGAGNGMQSYDVAVLYPVESSDDSYATYDTYTTSSMVDTGSYSFDIDTGSTDGYGAGTWHIGTYTTTPHVARPYRFGDMVPVSGQNRFISYHSFEVGTKDSATVKVENTDDIVTGFTQTINISVENESWMEEDNYEFRDMKVHITGIDGWDGTNEYDKNDIVCVNDESVFDFEITVDDDDDEAFYEFNYTFNSTGTATVWVSWPGNLTAIAGTDSLDPVTSSYSDRFNHTTSLIANITGKTTFSVGSPGGFNVFVEDPPESVELDSACSSDGYQNATNQVTTISVFGGTEKGEDSYKNATITVQGAGLDFTIEEDDEIADNEYLKDKDSDEDGNGSWYEVYINPKTAGTLTITVTNDTDTIEKDYTITGLTGSVTTSEGDDLEIEVGSTETITLTGVTEYAETWITFFDEDWECVRLLNESDDAGEFSFTPDADDIDEVGYIVVASGVEGLERWMYEIIEVIPVQDLTIEVVTPEAGNQTLTVGMQQEVVVKVLDADGDPVTENEPDLEITLYDVDGDEVDLGDDIDWNEIDDGEFEIDILPYVAGQLKIVGVNATEGIKHNGSTTLDVEHATITYSPIGATAGIGLDNLTIDVTGVDANGNPLSDVTLYLWKENDTGNLDIDSSVDLDEDGIGEFEISEVGDIKTHINATMQDNDNGPDDGNRTSGKFDIDFPTFTLNPDTVYVGRSNVVEIIAEDINGEALEDVYITLIKDNVTDVAPEPVLTDENGWVELSLEPSSSGKFNVTIVKELVWDSGQLDWEGMEYISTDTIVTASHIRTMRVSVSKSPIYQGETLTVTVTSGGDAIGGVDVEFAETTSQTDSNGEATFTVPDPGVESATYTVTAEKAGYETADKSITVLKVYSIQLVGPNTPPAPGEEFTVSVIVAGSPLAGATVEFNGETYTSNANGELTLTAPDSAGSHTISASYGDYEDGTLTITIEEGEEPGVPGFELLTLVAALGAAFILLRRRRRQ
jgi:hypothetical protein